LELLNSPGDPLPSALWSPLYLAAGALLASRSGLLTFSHQAARAAVARAYLLDQGAGRAARRRLADYFAARPWSVRQLEELPWHLAELGAWRELAASLGHPHVLTRAWETHAHEIKLHWARVERASPIRLTDTYRPLLQAPEDHPQAALA